MCVFDFTVWSVNVSLWVDKWLNINHPCWRRRWHPTPVLLPGKSHGQRSLVGCSPWGRYKSDTTEELHFHFSLSCIGEGNGNPLQCFYLENPRDGGTWWAAIDWAAQSQTRLKRLSSSLPGRSSWLSWLWLVHWLACSQDWQLPVRWRSTHAYLSLPNGKLYFSKFHLWHWNQWKKNPLANALCLHLIHQDLAWHPGLTI